MIQIVEITVQITTSIVNTLEREIRKMIESAYTIQSISTHPDIVSVTEQELNILFEIRQTTDYKFLLRIFLDNCI